MKDDRLALLQGTLDKIRRRLLDLTRRNPLLNYRFPKRSVRVVDELPSMTFQTLVAGQAFVLAYLLPPKTDDEPQGNLVFGETEGVPEAEIQPDPPPRVEPTPELPRQGKKIAPRHLDDELQTPFDPTELEHRCKTVTTAAKTALDETGANFLYLAIGFLDWYESDDSADKLRAPLILVPVEISKGKHDPETDTFQYQIRYLEDDVETNLSLAEKLSHDFGIVLPEFDSESEPEAYLAQVEEVISRYRRWRVAREMVVGLFSFSKILMYRELDRVRWPSNKQPANHPILGAVLGGIEPEPSDSGGLELKEIYDIDRDEAAAQIELVMDADSSQHSVLVDAIAKNKNLVVHGPPGTGKSQTITNLVAAALAAGKSVLFVAEKRAALEVVRTRLDKCGLGDFVLELHSHRTNKGQLLRDLDQRLNRHFPSSRKIDGQKESLQRIRSGLLAYSDAATSLVGPDREPFFEVVFRAGRYRAEAGADFPDEVVPDFPHLSRLEVQERASRVREAATIWKDLPERARQAWNGINLRNALGAEIRQIPELISQMRNLAVDVRGALQDLESQGSPVVDSLEALRAYVAASRFAEAAPRPSVADGVWPALADGTVVDQMRKLHERLKTLPALKAAAQALPQTPDIEGATFLANLVAGCDQLVDLNLGERNLGDLERLFRSCGQALEATQSLLGQVDAVREIMGTTPTFLPDFERVVAVAEHFGRIPEAVTAGGHPGWMQRTAIERLSMAELRAEELGRRLESAKEIFDLQVAPDSRELHRLAKRLGNGRSLLFKPLRSEYRAIRAEIRPLLQDAKQITAASLIDDIVELAGLKDEMARFADDSEVRDSLGRLFIGVGTDWGALRRSVEWMQRLLSIAGDRFLALDLLKHRADPASRLVSAASQIHQAATRLRERLDPCGLADRLEAPVSLIQRTLQKQNEVLEQALPMLQRCLLQMSATPRSARTAAAASLQLASTESEIEDDAALPELLGVHWKGSRTDMQPLLDAAAWIQELRATGIGSDLCLWLLRRPQLEWVSTLAGIGAPAQQLLAGVRSAFAALSGWGSADPEEWLAATEAQATASSFIAACDECLATIDYLNPWSEFSRAEWRLRELGHASIIKLIRSERLPPERLEAYFKALAFDAICRDSIRRNDTLADFTRAAYERAISQFRELDEELHALRSQRIAHLASQRTVPPGIGTGRVRDFTELALIRQELGKRMRHLPIRQLVRRASGALRALKPCFMMSPMSVAQYLVPGQVEFDLVVMDEASQVKPEDALGAILRAKQVVIVGDPKQLPPTAFFDRIADEEDDEDKMALEETESILEISQRTFPNRLLTWHYRSKHPSLIAFSNSQFYNNELLLFPAADSPSDVGVSSEFVEGATYKKSCNVMEARRVAEAVRQHLLHRHDESLGVAAMNSQQRDLILTEIERLQKTDSRFDHVLRRQDQEAEPLFIKNLENVQGDEREVIFISSTYGPDSDTNHVYQRFGPIAGDKGWRRLNVLFTRARKRVRLFTSLRPADVVVGEAASRGVAALHAYLEFAQSGRLVDPGRASARPPDSDFEEDVARLLAGRGYDVEPQVGVAGFFIDIGVRAPTNPNAFILGVECDGATYHSAKSTRDRDRIRQDILESMGWRIHRVWSTDWFKNRDAEIARLLEAVETAIHGRAA